MSTFLEDEPDFVRDDPGLACLLAQLERVNLDIERHERFKDQMAHAEKRVEELKAEEAVSLKNDSLQNASDSETEEWQTHFDDAVGAEYYFNPKTGEASWLPPPRKT